MWSLHEGFTTFMEGEIINAWKYATLNKRG